MRRNLLALVLLLSSYTAPAQFINNPTQAQAARDSLFQTAATLKRDLQQQTGRLELNMPRLGARRRIVYGYLPGGPAPYIWKHRTVQRRNGTVAEKLVARRGRTKFLQERQVNGSITYLRFYTTFVGTSSKARDYAGIYTREGYVLWNNKQYVLPKESR